jgi:CheY-like chemotaxis protein
MSAASLARVFDPFFDLRPDGTTSGFSLATCESIVLAHGGTIRAESELGRGTVFRVTLPGTLATVAMVPASLAVPAGRAPRGRVLVIDDELLVTDSIKRILEREHDVTLALRASDALELLARGDEFDLVLCDVMMPEVGGLELYAKIAELRPELLPRLVFMTAGAFTARAQAFLESVPNERLDKPFYPGELRAFVTGRIASLPPRAVGGGSDRAV